MAGTVTVLSGDVVTRTGELVLQPVRLLTKLNGEGGNLVIVSERDGGGTTAAAREAYAAETPRVEWPKGT